MQVTSLAEAQMSERASAERAARPFSSPELWERPGLIQQTSWHLLGF